MVQYRILLTILSFHIRFIKSSVISKTGNYASSIGSSVEMSCIPPNVLMNRSQAFGRGSVVWTDEEGREILNPRMETSQTGHLWIQDLHESDSGVYHCKFRPLKALNHDGGTSKIFVHKLIVYELPGHRFQTIVMFDVTQYNSETAITLLRDLLRDKICVSQLCSPGPVKTEACEVSDTEKQMCEISMTYESVQKPASTKCDDKCVRKFMIERLKQAQRLLETALELQTQNHKSRLRPDMQSFETKHILTCRPGYHLVEANYKKCFPCLPGTYSEGANLKCDLCPIGFFQEKFGSRKCEQCSDDKTTEMAGSKSRDECRPVTDTGILKDIKQGIASLFKG